jgi:hypothetical protein
VDPLQGEDADEGVVDFVVFCRIRSGTETVLKE